jgi:hypothetical protein
MSEKIPTDYSMMDRGELEKLAAWYKQEAEREKRDRQSFERRNILDNGRLKANLSKVEAERDRYMLELHSVKVQINNIKIIISD